MTVAINEAFIENCCLVRGIFLVWKIIILLLQERIFSQYTGLPPNVRFGERARAVQTWGEGGWAKSKMK